MRFLRLILKCVLALLLAAGLFALAGNALGYVLFKSVFSKLEYDTALPLSLFTAFCIMLTVVVTPYIVWQRWRRPGK
jgi:hypothetical protein